MKKCFIFLMILILIFPGCSRTVEVDGKAFVTAIGFDKGENYNLRFTFVFTAPSKNGKDSQGKEKAETIVIEAPSLYSAIEQINNFESKTIELTHTQTVVFSEELAREGLGEYIHTLVRSSHFRPNIYMCIADKSSMEFLEKINPVQTYHLEKYFQLIFGKMSSNIRGDLHLYDSYFGLLSGGGVSVLPFCAINEMTIQDTDEKSEQSTDSMIEKDKEEPTEGETLGGTFAENTDDYAVNSLAGKSVSKSANSAEIQGVGVLKDGVLLAVLGRLEAINLQMITNSFPDSYITLSNPDYPDKMITCYISQKEQSKIKVDCKDKPKVSIEINLEGDFSEVGEHAEFVGNPSKFEEYFEAKTKESIEKFLQKITNELDCDVCRFSEAAKSSFLTVKEWEEYNWKEKFSQCEYEVKVNLTVRTYGELSQRG